MEQHQRQIIAPDRDSLGALIVSEVRFLLESLAGLLDSTPGFHVCGQCETLAQAVVATLTTRPAIVLLDVAFPGGPQSATALSAALPGAGIVALALAETEDDVLTWAEAGITGYIPKSATIDDLLLLIKQISRGEQTCSSRVAGRLLRRIAASATERRAPMAAPLPASLTRRESEILALVGEGLSNKDIARRLEISLGTTKSHVHNLLGKLSLRRRIDAVPGVIRARSS